MDRVRVSKSIVNVRNNRTDAIIVSSKNINIVVEKPRRVITLFKNAHFIIIKVGAKYKQRIVMKAKSHTILNPRLNKRNDDEIKT